MSRSGNTSVVNMPVDELVPVICIAAALMCGCARGVGVSTVYDQAIDFKDYRSYALHPEVLEAAEATSIVRRLSGGIRKAMNEHGFVETDQDDADLLVIVYGVRKGDLSRPLPAVRRNYSRVVSAGDVYQYTEGNLAIDFLDRAAGEIVWHGVGESLISQDASPEDAALAVKRVLAQYPPGR